MGLMLLILACACLWATPVRAQWQRCNRGVGAKAPTPQQWPASTQVMMMPTVMDFGGPPGGASVVIWVFEIHGFTKRLLSFLNP
jgi:hypothetical protein